MQIQINAAVLLVTFNRPEYTSKVLEKIKEAKIKKLYVFNDGPRANNQDDKEAREDIKSIIKNIDWECNLQTLFSNENLGCGRGPNSAIRWAMENEDSLIILEDDCVPALSFFQFCDKMLERYKNDKRIWIISGTNHFNGEKNLNKEDSYFFSKYASIWGWATWKDRWEQNSFEMDNFPKFIEGNYIFNNASKLECEAQLKKYKKFYNNNKHKFHNHNVDTVSVWDAQFGFAAWANSCFSIVPAKNLISNIGVVGVHTNKAIKNAHNIPLHKNFKITKHPDFIQVNHFYDNEYYRLFRKKGPIIIRIVKKIKKLISQ